MEEKQNQSVLLYMVIKFQFPFNLPCENGKPCR